MEEVEVMEVPVNQILCGDCLEVMPTLPEQSVDLVFGSPPYEDCRTYGIGFALEGQAWVDWMVQVYRESLRVCKGLVAFVVEGKTRKFRWSATPALLMADLHRAGIHLRKPPLYVRDGIPGSGGPDWLKNKYEFIVCATNGWKLPWSNNTAMGHEPRCRVGGAPSHFSMGHRTSNGGDARIKGKQFKQPDKANPGNIIDCGSAGGGNMGSDLAHKNEAPFPESLAEFFIRSFCPPGGIVLDPFSGSGTTVAVAAKNGRRWIGIDVRDSQVDLSGRRIEEVAGQLPLFATTSQPSS